MTVAPDRTSELPLVLVVDDEVRSQEALARTLMESFEVLTASDAEAAVKVLEREWVRVVLCDQRMPGTSGVELLTRVRERWPDVVRIIISGYTDTEDIIAGINEAGIYQYITKPWQPESLLLTVRAAADLYHLQQENARLDLELRTAAPVLKKRVAGKRAELCQRYDFDRLAMDRASPLHGVVATARQVAGYDIPILITGESGTGKELLARAIHYTSPRAERTFVIENCGALSDQILESELFGHKRGAFTGAYEDRVGLFEQADGGTIFLDEIGETSPAMQVKLLRVLQEGEIRPLGSSRSRRIDVRVISATNRDLEAEVARGNFRADLYYRLAGFTLHLPPLRERTMDVPPIARAMLARAVEELRKPATGFSDEALDLLCSYRWPGNAREIQNEIYRMLTLARDEVLGAELVSPRVGDAAAVAPVTPALPAEPGDGSLRARLDAVEERILSEALRRHRGNKTAVARELGLSRVGLRGKLERLGLGR
ncbi:MAG: sigma-54 dependent transcriptional regulator [Gammaproteobacteria bacterium]|nr:sigma-54 dependent transcriptional regulator [Gammaproteobacteria bacterium]